MLQRLNVKLTPQCLGTPETEELAASAPLAGPIMKGSRRNNKKVSQCSASGPVHQHPIPRSPHPPPRLEPPLLVPVDANQRHRPADTHLGPVLPRNQGMLVHYPHPPFSGPFNYPPPPIGYPLSPPPQLLPPLGGQFGQSIQHTPSMQFIPCNPRRRTSSPIPGPHRASQSMENEEDYLRWSMRLEQGRWAHPCPVTICANSQSGQNNNRYKRRLPLGVPMSMPMQYKTMLVPVGFLPNGCYGPIMPEVYQNRQVVYPGNVSNVHMPGFVRPLWTNV